MKFRRALYPSGTLMKFKDAPSGQAASAKVEDEGVALRVTSIST